MEDNREELEAARSRLEALRFLFKSQGWGLLVKAYEGQLKGRQAELNSGPMNSIDEALQRNHSIGVSNGFKLALEIPKQMFIAAAQEYNQLLRESRGESSVSTRIESDNASDGHSAAP